MPSKEPPEDVRIVKFTNGRIVRGDKLVENDNVWVDVDKGKVVDAQATFYNGIMPERTLDLKGRILAPGFLDSQFNGAFGFDLSEVPPSGDMTDYSKGLEAMNRDIIRTGVTSYLATMTSQESPVYHQILPYLGPSGSMREPGLGAECVGAHCEGPFMAVERKGCHSQSVITGTMGVCTLEHMCDYYGSSNLGFKENSLKPSGQRPVKMITLAPELPGAYETIQQLHAHGIIAGVGHTKATYAQTVQAVASGATMVTHMFNAMNPLHHRDPGPYGVITAAQDSERKSVQILGEARPYFGIIADGIHLPTATVSIANATHSRGLILVTDAVKFMGCDDGHYDWNNGQRVKKRGPMVTLEGSDTIAGSAVTLLECVNNFANWTGSSIAAAINTVTSTPARMLGLAGVKGCLDAGADADMVVLSESQNPDGSLELCVDEVWKFAQKVFEKDIQTNGVFPTS